MKSKLILRDKSLFPYQNSHQSIQLSVPAKEANALVREDIHKNGRR